MSNQKNPILPLTVNNRGYFEFTLNDTKYYIREGVLRLKGKADAFGCEYNERLYFIDREMPTELLNRGLEFAKKHFLHEDFTIKIPIQKTIGLRNDT